MSTGTEPSAQGETFTEKVIEKSARNPFLVCVLVALGIGAGIWSLGQVALDAIPDLSDTQVIINTTWMGRSPDIIEDQVTYPIVTSLLSAPRVKYVRGASMFGESFVYVVFEDGTNLYWARSRVLEYLQQIQGRLPEGATPTLGPDATSVGWIYQYALVDRTGSNDLAQLRSFQDWHLRPYLRATEGVADVASVGGFVKQYQVELDPGALRGYGVSVNQIAEAIRSSNNDVGARLLEVGETEMILRGRGYIRSVGDIENIAVAADERGVPILLKQIGWVHLGPDIRRGVAELDGKGEVVGGIVIMRDGENALNVIRRLKTRLEDFAASLPAGVEMITTYDRSELIERSIETLREKLIKLSVIVSVVCLIFLFHLRSSLVAILTLPIAIVLSFIPMYWLGLTSNIMSLGGIAIAIGTMVDSAIIMIENAHKYLERFRHERGREARGEERTAILIEAAKRVGRPLFFSLLVITVSFIPVFTLEAQEGRLFKPLAFAKTFAMFFASLLGITLVPVLMIWFIRGSIRWERENPVSRFLIWLYKPVVNWVLRWRWLTLTIALLAMATTLYPLLKLGSEFMPPLNEGAILYMPTAPSPNLAIQEARNILQLQNQVIADKERFPEVRRVFGKIGRAETATDPAPLNMVETVILLEPTYLRRWHSLLPLPDSARSVLRVLWPEEGLADLKPTVEKLHRELPLPGMPVIPWMPIQTRLEMLATGVRSPVAVKIFGDDLEVIADLARQVEGVLRNLPGTATAFAEPIGGAYYLDMFVRRDAIARYGLTVGEVQEVIETAIGGKAVSTTIEGRERFPVNVRYARDFRKDPDALARVTVATMDGQHIPLSQLADIRVTTGPPEIKNENGKLVGLVLVDVMKGQDLVGYVERARSAVRRAINWSAYPGYYPVWAGQYEYWQRAKERLLIAVPFTALIIFVLLFLNTRSIPKTLIVLLAVPFSLIGAFWLVYLMGYNLSVAVWVGIIALAGLDAETGVVMLLYLDQAWERFKGEGRMNTEADLQAAIHEGAVQRVRPKIMTVATILFGLLPILFAHPAAAGADVMKRIAAPMIGGVVTSAALELLIYPVLFYLWRCRHLPKAG